jgi:hypothetical protein
MSLSSSKVEDIKSIEKCRNITSEIINFGVNDGEILKIIEILSLELEDTEMMRNINSLFKKNEKDEIEKQKLIL